MSDLSNSAISGQPVLLFAEECSMGAVNALNQDSVLHVRISLGELLIVADGVSGGTGGATASRMVAENFYAYLAPLPHDYPAENALRAAAAHANTQIVEAGSDPNTPGMRLNSTVVVALIQQDATSTSAWIGHIGDSRAYLLRAGRMNRLTTDHSVGQDLLKRSLIAAEDIQGDPDATALARSLGLQREVEIDLEHHPLGEGDTLLLCSYGLWGFVHEMDIQEAIAADGVPLEAAARNLFELALAAGGGDNIGIEMTRLILPSASSSGHAAQSHSPAAMWILGAFLVMLTALGVLTYLAFF